MSEEVVAAEGTSSVGTGVEEPTSLGDTSTEGAGAQAESGSEEPILYTVKVGGKEEKVTFDELQKGYMRQADYTRKTQELSQDKQRLAQAQQLAEAFERDPHGTVKALASYLNVDMGTARQVAEAAASEADDDPIARVERQLQGLTQQLTQREQAELQARTQAEQQAQAKALIESELAQLHAEHGDFPDMELIQYAVDNGLQDLRKAHRYWQFEAQEVQRIAELNAATEAKRRAQVVGGGHSAAPAAVASGPANGKMTVADAFMAALREHS